MSNLLIGQLPLASSPEYIQSGDLLAIQRADGETYQSYIYMSNQALANSTVLRDENGDFSANIISANLLGTSTYAQYLQGGNVGSIPYQSGVSTTSMLAVAPGLLLGGTTPSYVTTLPSIILSGLSQVTDPSTASLASLNTALQNVYDHGGGSGTGTVTTVSVATSNGLAGSVANPTTTPVITLSCPISGLLKSNGTALSAAVAGTDYVIPSGTVANATNAINATNSTNITATATSSNTSFYLALLGSATTGNKAVSVASAMTYIPSTNTLAANFAGSFSGNATTATRATNIAGGLAGQLVYQSANNTTALLPVGSGLLLGGTTPSYVTNLPSILNANAVIVNDPSTVGTNDLETTLLNIYNAHGGASGTVTSVSAVNTNGFSWNIATPNTTPNITLSTTVTGIPKGVAGAFTAAIAGTDYVIPSGNVATATTATNISGGVAGNVLYQSSAGTTSKISTANGVLFGGTTPNFSTTLTSALNANAIQVTDPSTASLANLSVALQNVYDHGGSGGGSVTSVSATVQNGFNFTITNPTTTPAILPAINISGVLKGSAGALVAAVSGTDYVIPSGTVANATTATNIVGGVAGNLLYQSGAGATSKVTTASGVLFGGTTPNFSTTLTSILNANAVQVTDPSTSSLANLSIALQNVYDHGGSGGGSVTNVSATVQNGFNFTVINQSTTPVIQPAISISGILKGAAGAVTQATAGVDYVTPAGTVANATNAVTATKIAGGTTGSLVYQTSAGNTGFVSPSSGLLSGGSIPSYITNLPSTIRTGSTTVTDPTTSANGLLNNALNNIYTEVRDVATGGTGVSSFTNFRVLLGGATIGQVASVGTAGQVLTSNGSGVAPTWQNASSGSSGLSPYDSAKTYNKGIGYITGDGTNGKLGFIYVCLVNGTTGAFDINDWAIESGLDLTNFNVYSATFGSAASVTSQYSNFIGYNAGTAPVFNANFSTAIGAFAGTSTGTISGEKWVSIGGSSANGALTTASYFTNLGFGAGNSLTTSNYGINIGYLAGSNITTESSNILIGDLGTVSVSNSFVVSNPQNNNQIINITNTNTAKTANKVLATAINASGAFTSRDLIPSYTTSARNALTGVAAGTPVLDITLGKLCFYTGSGWEVITSVAG